MQTRKLKWIVLALAPAVLLASLTNLVANRASGRLDDAAKLEVQVGGTRASDTGATRLARPTRLLLPEALDRAEDIRGLFPNDETRVLDALQARIGVSRPWVMTEK